MNAMSKIQAFSLGAIIGACAALVPFVVIQQVLDQSYGKMRTEIRLDISADDKARLEAVNAKLKALNEELDAIDKKLQASTRLLEIRIKR